MSKVETWAHHTRASLALGLPLVGANLAQMGINFTDTVMLGRLGAETLAASVLATGFFFIVLITGMGLAQAVLPMAAQAIGANDDINVRRSVRMGIWVALGFGVLSAPLLWSAEAVFLALGQNPELSALAGIYVRTVMLGAFPALMLAAVRAYISAAERTQIVLWITLAGVLLNALFDYALIFGNFGLPRLEIAGAAIASVASNLFMCAVIVVYAIRLPALKKYQIFVRFWRADWSALWDVIRLGVPISLTILAEVAMFTVAAVFMGWVGTIPLAAHGIALQITGIAFMIPLSLAQVGTVRVGLYYGRADRENLKIAGRSILVLGIGFAVFSGAAFLLFPRPLVGVYLDWDDPKALEILAYAVPLLAIAGAFQLVDSLQILGSNLLRGLKDSRIPMIYAVISYWVVGVPTSYFLGITLGWGGLGVWSGLAAGLLVAAVLMCLRYARREKLGLVTFR